MVSALQAYWVQGVATAPTITAIGKPRERAALPTPGVHVGRYTVIEPLGAGAMGAVFLASDPELGRRVAIKLLSSRGRDDHRLLDEARALAKLQHPNVVAIHDVGRWDDRVYIAMEHVAGCSLDGWLLNELVEMSCSFSSTRTLASPRCRAVCFPPNPWR